MNRKPIKKGIDIEDARKKREDNAVSIRKTKREESLSKKRNVAAIDKKVHDASIAQKVGPFVILCISSNYLIYS
jgi:hypothetical protein